MSKIRKKREKRGSLNHQIHQRMEQLKVIGESRYQAKLEYKEAMGGSHQNNTTVGIHSYNSYKAYKQTSEQFVKWLKENNKGVRNIEDITRDHIIEYVREKAHKGYSASSYSKDLAALNKLFMSNTSESTMKISKKECGVANKSFESITNNRELKKHHKKINLDNYKNEQLVGKSTGMRRESYTKVRPSDFNRDIEGQVISVELKEKNGKCRTAHRFRQQYSRSLYDEYISDNGLGKKGYKGFDNASVLNVSKNLGHNRDYVVKHYICVSDSLK